MHAIVITRPGAPDVLSWQEVPDPEPGPGEVLIDVAAAGINRADLHQRLGNYPPPPGAPQWPGLECSGRIAALGDGVTGWQVGDEVCALLSGGGYAERVAVVAGQVLPLPPGIDIIAAAGIPEAACTVWSNVFMVAGLRPGETLLVHGGTSGIGTMAIQLAKAAGAGVLATCGSGEKVERAEALGADVAINYHEEDFVARVHEVTDGRGADVILDVVGAAYLARNVEALAANGRLVVIGLQKGRRAELDLGKLLAKRGAVIATTLRGRPASEKAAIVAAVREHVWPLFESGALRPVVHEVLPITQAPQGHRILEEGRHVGKVILAVGDRS